MSKLEELIQEFCPNGVPVKTLGEVENQGILTLGRGKVISKDELRNCPGDYPVYSSSANGDGEIGRYGKYMFDDERITWSIDGGGKLFYRNAARYSVTNVGGWIKVNSTALNTKFLYYTLINQWTKMKFDYTKKAHPSVIRDIYNIYLPPLAVQQEIVRILDNFTELTAELTARRKQYEHYRDALLTFGNDIVWTQLKNIVTFKNGKGHEREIVENGPFIVVNSKFISSDGLVKKYSEKQIVPLVKNDILMVMSDLPNGKALAKCFVVDADNTYTLNQRICALHVKDTVQVNTSFLYYFLNRNKQLLKRDNGVDQTNLKKDDILEALVPLLPLSQQMSIVSILNGFFALCTDLTSGLPAEITARQKQYEYYRDKLLTFKELER